VGHNVPGNGGVFRRFCGLVSKNRQFCYKKPSTLLFVMNVLLFQRCMEGKNFEILSTMRENRTVGGFSSLLLMGAVALVFFLAVFFENAAVAQQIDCKVLVKKLLASGVTPKVTIDPEWGIARVTAADAFCREPVEEWRKRRLPWPAQIVKKSEMPKNFSEQPGLKKEPAKPVVKEPDTVPEIVVTPPQAPVQEPQLTPSSQEPVAVQPDPGSPLESEKKSEMSSLPGKGALTQGGKCDVALDQIWKGGWHEIEGLSYWLARVFTIDSDGDGFTDDLGFKFVAEGQEDVMVRYLVPSDQAFATAYPELALQDVAAIPRICFGQESFEAPEPVATTPGDAIQLISPDLAGEAEKRIKEKPGEASAVAGAEQKDEETKASDETGSGAGLWIAIAVVLLAIFGAAGFWFLRLRKGGKKEDLDDEEEEEEEEEDS
jgi:hypothetical protein